MSVLVKYKSDVEDSADQINQAFLDQYNKEIDQADAEIDAGNYVSHHDVEKLFQKRRN